jgi:hypothetical protein
VTHASGSAIVVGHLALAIGPEGVEETVVGASSGRSGPSAKGTGLIALLEVGVEVERGGERRSGAAESEQDGRESNHVD